MGPGFGATTRRTSGWPGPGSPEAATRALGGPVGDRFAYRGARLFGFDHDEVSRTLEDLAHQPIARPVGDLDDDGAVGQLLHHGPLLAKPAGAVARDPDPGDTGGVHLPA